MPPLTQIPLHQLQRVDVRDVWRNEEAHFTPWLAEAQNLDLLGEALGIDLTLEEREKNVGPYRADLVCKQVNTENWVLIENQLGRTDHGHLGQLLTYAASLEAVTVAWIAPHFTDGHRAALDWLNRKSDDSIRFFGLEIEVWKVGDSLHAPRFNVVAKPDSPIGPSVDPELNPFRTFQLDFWTGFIGHLRSNGSSRIAPVKAKPANWIRFNLGKAWFFFVCANRRCQAVRN